MEGNIFKQLTQIMKEEEPNLAPIIREFTKDLDLELPFEIIVKNINFTADIEYSSGSGLKKLFSLINISFKEDFKISFKAPNQPKISLKIDSNISIKLANEGLTNIEGIKVDLPGPFDPAIKSILIEKDQLAIKGSFPTQYIPLLPELI